MTFSQQRTGWCHAMISLLLPTMTPSKPCLQVLKSRVLCVCSSLWIWHIGKIICWMITPLVAQIFMCRCFKVLFVKGCMQKHWIRNILLKYNQLSNCSGLVKKECSCCPIIEEKWTLKKAVIVNLAIFRDILHHKDLFICQHHIWAQKVEKKIWKRQG